MRRWIKTEAGTSAGKTLRGLASMLAIGWGLGQPAESAPPNLVVMLLDNVGYGDLGCYGNRAAKTPHLDALAAQGVRCLDFYVASPSCMPSRGALLTGRHPLRTGLTEQVWRIDDLEQRVLPLTERLFPEYLKPAGYVSACFGKWNLGFAPGHRPTERGFDEFFGHASGNMHEFTHVYHGRNDLFRGVAPAQAKGYSTDLFSAAACEFIRRHAARPFFVYLAFNAAHFPNPRNFAPGEPVVWQVPPAGLEMMGWPADEPDPKRRYLAVLAALDAGVGRVLAQLDESRVAANTIVVILSDNGAFMLKDRGREVASNLPLRDGGTTTYEGGIRVPALVRWPARLKAGTVCREPLVAMDLLPLALGAAGLPPPRDRPLDGHDPTAALRGEAASPHAALYFEYGSFSGARFGNLKLVRAREGAAFSLYDLREDPGETRDLAAVQPQVRERLLGQRERWLAGLGAAGAARR